MFLSLVVFFPFLPVYLVLCFFLLSYLLSFFQITISPSCAQKQISYCVSKTLYNTIRPVLDTWHDKTEVFHLLTFSEKSLKQRLFLRLKLPLERHTQKLRAWMTNQNVLCVWNKENFVILLRVLFFKDQTILSSVPNRAKQLSSGVSEK